MSLSRVLSTAKSALMAHQWAMSVTANNIANAQTPGFTRQRLQLQAGAAGGLYGYLSGGVRAEGVSRVRDQFLDASYRRESSLLGGASTTLYYLERVEGAMNEPSDAGVGAALDSMFQAFGDLANDPSSAVHREEVRRAAENFTRRLNHLADSIGQAAQDAVSRMRAEVDEVNRLTQGIAALNARIQGSGAAGAGSTPELLDQRDLLLDQLSSLVSVEAAEAEDGTMTVTLGGATLVSGADQQNLAVKTAGGTEVGIGLESDDQILSPTAGSLKALVELVTTTLPEFRQRLDTLAEAVVNEVNALHRTGYTADGRTGLDFFDPASVTSANITLSAAVEESADAIAIGRTREAGDNALALELAALGLDKIDRLGGDTFTGYYAAFATTVGRSVSGAVEDEEASRALVDNADAWRASVEGVSLDEEMVTLISQQEAYQAAARLIGVADEMMQEILRILP